MGHVRHPREEPGTVALRGPAPCPYRPRCTPRDQRGTCPQPSRRSARRTGGSGTRGSRARGRASRAPATSVISRLGSSRRRRSAPGPRTTRRRTLPVPSGVNLPAILLVSNPKTCQINNNVRHESQSADIRRGMVVRRQSTMRSFHSLTSSRYNLQLRDTAPPHSTAPDLERGSH
jgi:hypothetical protein